MRPVARTALALVVASAMVRCSLFVDTSGIAGTALDASDARSADVSAQEAASLEASVDADAGDPNRADAAVWPGNGHAYLAVATPIPLSWQDAKLAAVMRGGHLATLTSIEENAFVWDLVRNRTDLLNQTTDGVIGPWLGGFHVDKTSPDPAVGWQWVTGETWGFTSWAPTQPDNSDGTEDALHFFPFSDLSHATWNDIPYGTTDVHGYVVEFE